MSALQVTEVSGRRGLKRFLAVAKRLYPPSSPWVAPLDLERRRFFNPRKNPFFDHARLQLFVARDGAGRDLGRIAAIDNPRHKEFQGEDVGFFGFFEAPDDPLVAQALLGAAERWVRERGHPRIRGPVNPSTNHECGLLVEGFDRPPMVQMPYNHPYHESLLLGAGYRGTQELVALLYTVDASVPERIVRAQRVLARRHGFTLRLLDLKDFDAELRRVKLIYNEAWAANSGFVPLTDGEIDYLARDLKPVIEPRLCWFAEVGGEPAGFALALPDINQALKPLRGRLLPFGWLKLLRGLRRLDAMRAMVLGVRPRFRNLGIDYAFYHRGLLAAQSLGIKEIEVSWVLAENLALLRPVETFGARLYKRYRLYEKDIA